VTGDGDGGTTTVPPPGRPRPEEDDDGEQRPTRRLTTNQEYPEAVEWETYEVNAYDPQSGQLVTEPLDNTELDSLQVQGKTEQRPQAGQAKIGNLNLNNDLQGQVAEQVDARSRDVNAEAALDSMLPSDPEARQRLTSQGRYPDLIVWLSRNRKRYDPQTGELTSDMIDDTALRTLQVQGETGEPPADSDVRVGNLRVKSDGQGAEAEPVRKKELQLPVSGLPQAEDVPGGRRGKRGRRSRGGKSKSQVPLLTDMVGENGTAEPPVLIIK